LSAVWSRRPPPAAVGRKSASVPVLPLNTSARSLGSGLSRSRERMYVQRGQRVRGPDKRLQVDQSTLVLCVGQGRTRREVDRHVGSKLQAIGRVASKQATTDAWRVSWSAAKKPPLPPLGLSRRGTETVHPSDPRVPAGCQPASISAPRPRLVSGTVRSCSPCPRAEYVVALVVL